MNNPESAGQRTVQGLAVFVTGLGIGWLIGLSVSPVIGHVLGAVIGLVAGVVAALRVFAPEQGHEMSHRSVDALPAALLVAGLAIGAPAGIVVRTHHYLELKESVLLDTPKEPSKPPAGHANEGSKSAEAKQSKERQDAGVLYGANETECGEMVGAMDNDADLRDLMKHSKSPWVRALAAKVQDPNSLRAVVEEACQKAK